jgi:hypothetical protein
LQFSERRICLDAPGLLVCVTDMSVTLAGLLEDEVDALLGDGAADFPEVGCHRGVDVVDAGSGARPVIAALQGGRFWDQEYFQMQGFLGPFLSTVDESQYSLGCCTPCDRLMESSRLSCQGWGIVILVRGREIKRRDDLLRGGCELRAVIQQRLLRGGQLKYVYYPVHLHNQKGADSKHCILGGLQRRDDWPQVLKQGCSDGSVLGQDKARVDSMGGGKPCFTGRRRTRDVLGDSPHSAEPRADDRLVTSHDP